MVAAPLALGAVERGAVADRDEGVLEAAAARMVGVDVAGRDRRDAERRRELGERGVPAGVAALVGPLELDVERAGERLREPRGAVRVGDGEPVARAAGEADEPLGVLGDDARRSSPAGSSSRSRPSTRVRACASVRIRQRFA